jgi:hypothetical protein
MLQGETISFTFYWHDTGQWENQDFRVEISDS